MPTLAVNSPFRHRFSARSTGSVLLAVLCLVATLSFLVVMTVSISQQHGDMQQVRQGMMRARQLAEMGVAVAAHPQIKSGDPLLRRKVSGVERFDVILGTEESRLNLNALLTEQHLPVLERMFKSWGMSAGDAQGMAATPVMTGENQASEELLETLRASAASRRLTVQKKQLHEPVTAADCGEVGVTLTVRGPLSSVFRWMHGLLSPAAFRVVSQVKITPDAANPADVVAIVHISQLHAPAMAHEPSPEVGGS